MSYDVSEDYSNLGGQDFSLSSSWCIAVFRLGKPVSYSRKTKASIGSVMDGVFLRKQKPLILTDDVVQMHTSSSKRGYLKTLSATLKGDKNFLSSSFIFPGDWIFAWAHTNPNDTDKVVAALRDGKPANWFHSGIKFVGRVHGIGKNVTVSDNAKSVSYSLQGSGFDELSTIIFYDSSLATVESTQPFWQFFGSINANMQKFLFALKTKAGHIKDNSEDLFEAFLDVAVGSGLAGSEDPLAVVQDEILGVGAGIENGKIVQDSKSRLTASPQIGSEAPYTYLVPTSVAATLGRSVVDDKKGDKNGHTAFGYRNILNTITGVQKYSKKDDSSPHKGFVPILSKESAGNVSTLKCDGDGYRVKGTFIPIEQSFVNTPLWDLLRNNSNPTINEMYTTIKPDSEGNLFPSIVFRQIPFSTDVIEEKEEFPLTRFLSLPRWKIPGALITNMSIGRSNANRFNFVSIVGQLDPYAPEKAHTKAGMLALNPPVWDALDIARSGVKPYIAAVACSVVDTQRPDGARLWMEAVADWSFGHQYTLAGQITCFGIQAPIAEGDNVEIESVAYHIESVSHSCSVSGPSGVKSFQTTLVLSNGMPIDQGMLNDVAPRYPGFHGQDDTSIDSVLGEDASGQNEGDDSFATSTDPGFTVEGR
jgi:hypothetical protein